MTSSGRVRPASGLNPHLRYYSPILEHCQPYLVARAPVAAALNKVPLGLAIPPENVIDPQRVSSGPFLNLVKRLDEMAYGPLGMLMPSWVFYDCAVMPGALFGFARPAAELDPWVRRPLGIPDDYEGLVPMSSFIAIPTVARPTFPPLAGSSDGADAATHSAEAGVRRPAGAEQKGWLCYSLCSINEVAAGAAPEGLWRLTLAAGTEAMGIREMRGTCRWRSPRLGLYAGMSPLHLVTAYTPAHDIVQTVTFDVQTGPSARARLLRGDSTGPEGIHRYIDADDSNAMMALQDEIEAGMDVYVAGAAEIRGAQTRVPLMVGGDEHWGQGDAGFVRRFQG